jgi:hypothetical protein
MPRRLIVGLITCTLAALPACGTRSAPPRGSPHLAMAALEVEADDVYVRVVDVGPGLCTVIRVPENHFMVYDSGHWNGQHCINAVRELVTGDTIDLMVISHSGAACSDCAVGMGATRNHGRRGWDVNDANITSL